MIDRFHVAQHYRDGADTLRKQEWKRLRAELPHETMDQLKHTMWPFRKPPSDLNPDEQDRRARLFERHRSSSRRMTCGNSLPRSSTRPAPTRRASAASIAGGGW